MILFSHFCYSSQGIKYPWELNKKQIAIDLCTITKMNREELERLLESVISIKNEIRSIELLISELISFYPCSSEKLKEKIDQKQKELEDTRFCYLSQISDIEDILKTCFDKPSIESSILRYRYINGLSWKEIEAETNYSRRQLTNYKNKALDHVLCIINGDIL